METTTVVMLADAIGEDGTIWRKGNTYTATLEFADALVLRDLANTPDGWLLGWTGLRYDDAGNPMIVGAGGVRYALSEIVGAADAITSSGTVQSGAGYFRGLALTAISGTPQTATVYDNTAASGKVLAVYTLTALGAYLWDGDWATPGLGAGGRVAVTTGVYVAFSGGTSRTVLPMVEAA